MAITPRTQTGNSFTGNSFTPVKPSGTVNGDLLILHIGFEKGSGPNITASQWTLIRRDDNSSNVGGAVYRRIEDGAALTAVTLTQGPKGAWTVARFDGHDATTPIPTHNGANGASGNPDPPAVTATVADCLALVCGSNKKAGTGTPPAGYTEFFDRANTADGIGWSYGAYKQLTGTPTENPAAIVAAEQAEWAAQTILIAPSGGAQTVGGSFTANAVMKKTIGGSLTANAVIRKTQAQGATADAIIRRPQQASAAADAIIFRTQTATLAADAVLLVPSFTADAVLLRTTETAATFDAVLERTQIAGLTADAVIFRTQAAIDTADAVLLKTQIAFATADAVIKTTLSVSFAADAEIITGGETVTDSFTADAILVRISSATFAADAVVSRTQQASLVADAVIFRAQTASFVVDAVIEGAQQVVFAADALLGRVGPSFWIAPADGVPVGTTPTLEFRMADVAGPVIFFQLQLDTSADFDSGDLRTYTTYEDNTGWEYWNNTDWVAVPLSGVPASFAGNSARLTVPTPLSNDTWYRRVRAGTR